MHGARSQEPNPTSNSLRMIFGKSEQIICPEIRKNRSCHRERQAFVLNFYCKNKLLYLWSRGLAVFFARQYFRKKEKGFLGCNLSATSDFSMREESFLFLGG
jgi:hypothetical protein